MSDAPWTPEQRAAKEADLARLLALKAQREEQQLRAATTEQQHQHQQQQQQQQPVRMGYGYANDDDGEDDDERHDPYNAAEEAFLDSAESFLAGAKQHQDKARPVEEDIAAGATVATTTADYAAHRRELGDFELLRLAKMGDAVSFFDFAKLTQADITDFTDNQGLNALHYAADSGNLQLVQQLRAKRVPYHTCEKGSTPLDIAILTRQPQEVLDELKAIAAECNHRDGSAAAGAKSFEEVLARLAPAPPKFVMSKPTPTQPAAKRTGAGAGTSFWDLASRAIPSAENAIAPSDTLAVTVEAGPVTTEDVAAVRRLSEARNAVCGCSGWLAPMETLLCSPAMLARTVKASARGAQQQQQGGEPLGLVVAVQVGGEIHGVSKSANAVPTTYPLYVADHLVTAESAAGDAATTTRGLASVLLSSLAAALTRDTPEGKLAVAFTTPALIREPPSSVCMIKWYRRAVDALPVFADYKLTDVIFPAFSKYDETLRADCVAKGAVPHQLAEKHAASIYGWARVDPTDDTQAATTLAFLRDKTSAGGAELFYVPTTLEDLRGGGLLSEGVSSLVKLDATSGAITDFVAFRLRRSAGERAAADGGDTTAPAVVVAELVYAVITSLKLTDKAEQLLLIAKEVLHAQVLLVPGTFGFAESDLVKANFDELPALREFVYVVSGKEGKVQSAPPLPAAKLCLPLFLL